jgi:hypothetical protein
MKSTHIAYLLLPFALLWACAAPQIRPIARGGAMSIRMVELPQKHGDINLHNTNLDKGASTGAGVGMAAGVAWGLACGPFAPFCLPLTIGAAGAVGTATGAAVGATIAISPEKVARLSERMTRLRQDHPVTTELERNLNERAQQYWVLNSSQPKTVLHVEVQPLRLSSTHDEQLNFALHVNVWAQQDLPANDARTRTRPYQYVSPFASLAVWLDEGNDFLASSLTTASQQIANQVIADLAVDRHSR